LHIDCGKTWRRNDDKGRRVKRKRMNSFIGAVLGSIVGVPIGLVIIFIGAALIVGKGDDE
jgi:hypothetical protein